MEAQREKKFRLGWQIIAILAALTAFEFWVASVAEGPIPYPVLCWPFAPITWLAIWISKSPLPFLGIIAIIKAGLIAHYFMHISQLWKQAEEAH
jgi:hypothetical protein